MFGDEATPVAVEWLMKWLKILDNKLLFSALMEFSTVHEPLSDHHLICRVELWYVYYEYIDGGNSVSFV